MKAEAVNRERTTKRLPRPESKQRNPQDQTLVGSDEVSDQLGSAEAEAEELKARIAALEVQASNNDSLRQQAEQALALTRRQFSRVLDAGAVEHRSEQASGSRKQHREATVSEQAAWDERKNLWEQLNSAERKVKELTTRVSELETAISDQESLKRQAEQALALTRRQFTRLLDGGRFEDGVEAASSILNSLRQELAEAQGLLSDTKHELSVAENNLRQRREENAQAWSELSSANERLETLQAELTRQANAKAELEEQLADANAWTFKLARDRQIAEAELSRAQRLLQIERDERERVEEEVRALEFSVRSLQESLEASEQSRLEAVARRAEASDEIVVITRLLRASESNSDKRREQLEWLARVFAVLEAKPRWWFRLVPPSFHRRRQLRNLAREHIFDADEYLRRYPDVRDSRQDPLRHYLLHGMAEGRTV